MVVAALDNPVDLLVLLVIAVLIFGKRLPEVARSVGKGIRELKESVNMDDMSDTLNTVNEIRTAVSPSRLVRAAVTGRRRVPQHPQRCRCAEPAFERRTERSASSPENRHPRRRGAGSARRRNHGATRTGVAPAAASCAPRSRVALRKTGEWRVARLLRSMNVAGSLTRARGFEGPKPRVRPVGRVMLVA